MKKPKKYIVKYSFDGNGEALIKAKSKEEAEEIFSEGDFVHYKEWGENVFFENIKEVEKPNGNL